MSLDLAELMREADKIVAESKAISNPAVDAQRTIAEQLTRIADSLEIVIGDDEAGQESMLVSLTHQITRGLSEISETIIHLAERLAR